MKHILFIIIFFFILNINAQESIDYQKPPKEILDLVDVQRAPSVRIDENNEYAEKLEHLDSLIKLGESTVIEADSEAERIKLQANERVDEEVRAVLTEAEEQARAAAERIIAEADKNAFDRISASEQLAQDMLAMAADRYICWLCNLPRASSMAINSL